MEQKVIDVLKSIGLAKNEVLVYLDMIAFQTSSASKISERTKLHRANVYDALNKLIARGFVTEVLVDNKKLFRSLEVEQLKTYVHQKEKEIDEIIPFMKNLRGSEISRKDEVVLSKGVFSFRNILMIFLENLTKKELNEKFF